MLNKKELTEAVNNKLISVQKHPDTDLFIYNYTPKVQYEKLWNETTLNSRGLILDVNMNIVSKPFGKFFNIEEHSPDEIPNLPFDVYEKMDGSLGILYWIKDKPFIATKGSFTSDQAKHANNILYERYGALFDKLDKNSTYLFEIIYPENRIVVNYGQMDDLILLTIIDNSTGVERIEDIGFPIVKHYDGINDIYKLKNLKEDNREGFVVRFENGFRVKVKFEEYIRLHRILTNVSSKVIWEYLSTNQPLDELITKVPDEFYDWVKYVQKELIREHDYINNSAKEWFNILNKKGITKKEFALSVLEICPHISSVVFSLYNNKPHEQIIWKMIKPKYCKPFKVEN